MKTLRTWKIAYTIEDGPYEYYDYLLRQAAGEMTEAAAAAAVAAFWCADDEPEDRKRFRRALVKEGYAALPASGRLITGLGWEKVSPIIITVSGGVVNAVSGVPDGVTVEVHDWDGDERDEAGEPVPDIAVWEGPC